MYIKSRPYHPQSQGKVERMHKSLKRKIAYDLTHANPCGINWAKQLPEYQRVLNNTPKECLGWSTPCKIYYRRDAFEKYKLKRCSNKACCKQCRYVKFKGTTKWPVQKLTHRTTQKHVQHHDATDI